MDRLAQRISIAHKALETLAELPLEPSADTVIRDAAIQRFKYTLEAVWKAAQLYLREREGIDLASPKGVVRACYEVGILTEAEARWGMQMVDDRNLTAHTSTRSLPRPFSGVQFANYLLPLVTLPYLARVLGPEGWGSLAVGFRSL